MDVKAYDYMDWPRIEAVVYGEEASPRDVMSPRLTPEGVLIQGFFPGCGEGGNRIRRQDISDGTGRRGGLFRGSYSRT